MHVFETSAHVKELWNQAEVIELEAFRVIQRQRIGGCGEQPVDLKLAEPVEEHEIAQLDMCSMASNFLEKAERKRCRPCSVDAVDFV